MKSICTVIGTSRLLLHLSLLLGFHMQVCTSRGLLRLICKVATCFFLIPTKSAKGRSCLHIGLCYSSTLLYSNHSTAPTVDHPLLWHALQRVQEIPEAFGCSVSRNASAAPQPRHRGASDAYDRFGKGDPTAHRQRARVTGAPMWHWRLP